MIMYEISLYNKIVFGSNGVMETKVNNLMVFEFVDMHLYMSDFNGIETKMF